jgi:hypothetical protein
MASKGTVSLDRVLSFITVSPPAGEYAAKNDPVFILVVGNRILVNGTVLYSC